MNMKVSDDIKIDGKNTLPVNDARGIWDNVGDIISDISDIIFKMNELFKKMRDLLNAYNQKQQSLGWDVQVNSLENKREAITNTATGAYVSGGLSILSGLIGGAGAGASTRMGDIAMHTSSALGQMSTGAGKIAEGDMSRSADLLRMTSDLQSSGAQSYNKNLNELQDKIRDIRQGMKDFGNTLVNMANQIAMAAKL
jgi:secreted effector protein SseD